MAAVVMLIFYAISAHQCQQEIILSVLKPFYHAPNMDDKQVLKLLRSQLQPFRIHPTAKQQIWKGTEHILEHAKSHISELSNRNDLAG